ncbi:F-box/LRR-repeat protein 25-like isoform X2 [Lycium ferocissimum]|uniref:F-box/LRR-repeat protein 25-like isoform X2 n=1 Tax=Lycium ferocissimum TaxID=112874 RepID=UPI00281649F7|nr:F-box/LRR-repeat protein 25-like isoform X2 [Lycium ferocissimum]
MEMQKKIMLRGDLLSDLPEPILIHILSMLPAGGKEVVRTSVLSTRWRFLWKSVPVSLDFDFPTSDSEKDTLDYLASIHRELYYWRSSHKIRRFRVWRLCYEELYAKHVDLWVHFATTLANVEEFQLGLFRMKGKRYEFPQFAYKNVSLRNLVLWHCQLNPSGSVNWINLVSLSIGKVELTEGVMEKVLSGCPNLECLELDDVSGIRRLEISSVKLRELTIQDYNDELWLEIIAPYIKNLELSGFCCEIRIRQRNVASLVTAMLHLNIENNLEKKISYLKELLHSVAHVEDLKLGTYCIEDLLSRYINEDEQTRRFETHNFNCSFPHLKTIKIINFYGSVLPLVKYLLKHATMLEKFVIVAAFEESDVSPDYFEMAQELLSFPRSSPHASVIFSY